MERVYLKEPFNMIISGITNCGKTKYILDLIESEYKCVYDFAIIICPTYLWNKTYHRRWIYEDIRVIIIDPREIGRAHV